MRGVYKTFPIKRIYESSFRCENAETNYCNVTTTLGVKVTCYVTTFNDIQWIVSCYQPYNFDFALRITSQQCILSSKIFILNCIAFGFPIHLLSWRQHNKLCRNRISYNVVIYISRFVIALKPFKIFTLKLSHFGIITWRNQLSELTREIKASCIENLNCHIINLYLQWA